MSRMKSPTLSGSLSRSARILCAAVLFAAACGATHARAQTPPSAALPMITQPINNASTVPLHGNVHPLAIARNDRGAVPASTGVPRMLLLLKRPPAREADLKQFLSDVQTPGSGSYHHWLTPTQFGARFGPADSDIQQVQAWLQSQGFTVSHLSPARTLIEFSGTVGQIQSAFHTPIHRYLMHGELHLANAKDPEIPAALAPVIRAVGPLHDYRPHSMIRVMGRAAYDARTHKVTPEWTYPVQGGNYYAVAPEDFSVQYNTKPLLSGGSDGSGQTIAIINDSNIDLSTSPNLVSSFRSLFSLPASTPQVVIDGNDPGVNGDAVEAYLDVEWAGAVAPGATVKLYTSANTTLQSGLILAAKRAIEEDTAPILSVSFGLCEAFLGTSYNQFISSLWQEAAAQGQTVLVAAGDSGSAGCDDPSTETVAQDGLEVSGFASTPYNIAVGGTDFYYSTYSQGSSALNNQIATYWNQNNDANNGSLIKTIPEQPWDDSQFGLNAAGYDPSNPSIAGAGGGASSCVNSTTDASGNITCQSGYPKPAWQSGTGVPSDSVRDIPDVSLFAANGANFSFYPICAAAGDCSTQTPQGVAQVTPVGGTSASTPAMAAIMAIINQKYGRQGQADYVLYPMAAQHASVFHDVTNGSNDEPCSQGTPNCSLDTNNDGYYSLQDYGATTGYDLASGWGSFDANALVTNWNSITFKGTSTTLTVSPTSFKHGSSVTLSTSVSSSSGGTPTGTVALVTNNQVAENDGFTTIALTNGSGTATSNALPGGTYQIYGQYSGDGTYGTSKSPTQTLTVTPESSNINLSINTVDQNGNPVPIAANGSEPYGTYISADIQPTGVNNTPSNADGIATGTALFQDSAGAAAATVNLNSYGEAEYLPGYFGVAAHTISAKYSGDVSFTASSGSATFTVTKAPTAVSGSAGPGSAAGTTTLSITVTPTPASGAAAPTGTVSVAAGSTQLGSGQVGPSTDPNTGASLGKASITFTSSSIPSGTTTVNLSYSGDGNYQSSSASVPISSTPGFSLAAMNSSVTIASPGATGSTVITATPTNGFTGAINFTCTVSGPAGAQDLPTCSLSPASATVSSGAVTTTLNIATTAASSSSAAPIFRPLRWMEGGGAALACLLMIGIPGRRRSWQRFFGFFLLIAVVGAAGCSGGSSSSGSGGGGGGGGGGTSGTTAGAYTVTVTGTSGTVSPSTTVAVTVQ
jgi:hypothetical protein